MLPKLLAIDLDGTTLNSDGEISVKNQQYLQKITQSGVQLVVATGRSSYSASQFITQMGVKQAYIVALNGAAVYRWGDSEPLMTTQIPESIIDEIISIGDSNQINTYFSTLAQSYVWVRDQSLMAMFASSHELKSITTPAELKADRQHFAKILYCTKNPEYLANLVTKVQALPVEAAKPDEMCLELTAKNTSKANGLAFLGQHLNILPAEMAAVGDSENDFEMLKFVGNSIVMANGMPHIKAIADYVTLSNDRDGLAHAIERLLG